MTLKILTAGRGEGKTTFLVKYARRIAMDKRSVGGIASPALYEGNRRIGYELVDLHEQTRWRLAGLGQVDHIGPIVGPFSFDQQAIDAGRNVIISAVRNGFDVVAIDEVGPLEFRGEGWAPALEIALDECRDEQELIIAVRPSLVHELSKRFPSPAWSTAHRISPPWPDLPDT